MRTMCLARRATIALCALFVLAVTAPAAERPPNIVLIFADDLGWGDVGFNGRTEWKTPHLDRLARQGTVFRRWYAGGVTCAPSRAVLLTGKYTIHNGAPGNQSDLPRGEVTVAEALKQRGYVTGLFGKWHHGRPRPGEQSYVHPLDQGFDEFFGFTNASHAWQKFPKELWDGRAMKPVSGYADTLFTDRGVDFLRRNKDRPFFLYLPYTNSHFNIEAPPGDVTEHKGTFTEKDPAKPLNATYAAMVTRLDKEVGRVLKALDDLGLAANTLVVFSCDHGATFEPNNQGTSAYHDSNRPFRGQKRTLWEGGVRVPGVVRWPGRVPAGRVSGEIVHMIDVLPTLLAAAGARPDPAWKVDGRSLLAVWAGREKAPERTLFWEWLAEGTFQLAAMRGDFKLVIPDRALFETVRDPGAAKAGGVSRQPELYDVATDPAERRSVYFEHQPLARQLQQELLAWLATETEESKQGRQAYNTAEKEGKAR